LKDDNICKRHLAKETHFFIVSGVNFHVGIASALIGESQRAELAIVRLDALKKKLK
jgi:hypothetical protein